MVGLARHITVYMIHVKIRIVHQRMVLPPTIRRIHPYTGGAAQYAGII